MHLKCSKLCGEMTEARFGAENIQGNLVPGNKTNKHLSAS